MNRHPSNCRCCLPGAVPEPPPVHEPVTLPAVSRPFRVHLDGRTQDCTLHPDGRMTMQAGGQELTSMLGFDEMRQREWLHADIEWNPGPLPEPEPVGVQDAIPLTA